MELESFLQPMLNLNPLQRADAKSMLTHEWLQGVRFSLFSPFGGVRASGKLMRCVVR